MKREIITTNDGSKTIQLPEWNEQYHSIHGAVQEAQHVFLDMGLFHYLEQHKATEESPIQLLEIGFGTGLNAFLTLLETIHKKITIYYTGIEAYPVSYGEAIQMEYPEHIGVKEQTLLFEELHHTSWGEKVVITPQFSLTKRKQTFETITDKNSYDLIYFDAFGARVQPELWTEAIFQKMYMALGSNGVLVTYAAKGSVRRAMQSVGFTVERLPGPPGKREMLRATKS